MDGGEPFEGMAARTPEDLLAAARRRRA